MTESVENYDRVCSRMAQFTGHIVMSVEYRLAPEYHFPVPLEDCYAAAKALYTGRLILPADPDRITIIGDSAGGNLAAAVCLLARERGEFMPRKQILIYPALNNCYTEESPIDPCRKMAKAISSQQSKWKIISNYMRAVQMTDRTHILHRSSKKTSPICRIR